MLERVKGGGIRPPSGEVVSRAMDITRAGKKNKHKKELTFKYLQAASFKRRFPFNALLFDRLANQEFPELLVNGVTTLNPKHPRRPKRWLLAEHGGTSWNGKVSTKRRLQDECNRLRKKRKKKTNGSKYPREN